MGVIYIVNLAAVKEKRLAVKRMKQCVCFTDREVYVHYHHIFYLCQLIQLCILSVTRAPTKVLACIASVCR